MKPRWMIIAKSVLASPMDGLVISNTTIERPYLQSHSGETGGLSGRPLFERSTIVLAKMRDRVGCDFPIIGVGGIDNVDTAWEKLAAGANLLQLYTAMIYHGPDIANAICQGLADRLKAHGLDTITSVTWHQNQAMGGSQTDSGSIIK